LGVIQNLNPCNPTPSPCCLVEGNLNADASQTITDAHTLQQQQQLAALLLLPPRPLASKPRTRESRRRGGRGGGVWWGQLHTPRWLCAAPKTWKHQL